MKITHSTAMPLGASVSESLKMARPSPEVSYTSRGGSWGLRGENRQSKNLSNMALVPFFYKVVWISVYILGKAANGKAKKKITRSR